MFDSVQILDEVSFGESIIFMAVILNKPSFN